VKGKNLIGTVTVTVSTTDPVHQYLEELVETGLYGKNAAEAAERVIVLGLEELLKSGRVQQKPVTDSNA